MIADEYVLQRRTENFCFQEYVKTHTVRHAHGKCVCKKKNKTCVFQGYLEIAKLVDPDYVSSVMPMLETLYQVMQSVTQSMRSKTGKEFETIIGEVLRHNRIPHATQVYYHTRHHTLSFTKTPHQSHPVDFVVPVPKDGDDAQHYRIISCKTRLRERRCLEDKFMSVPYTLISLDPFPTQDDQVHPIHIRSNSHALDDFVQDLKKQYGSTSMESITSTTPLRVLDLFCGCGGFSWGLKEAGLDVMLGVDIWDKAVDSYRRNMAHKGLCKDLTTFPPEECEKILPHPVDILVGGPPCQSFSMAGRRDKNDPRGSLFMEYVRYLNHFRPKAFLFENVVGILSMRTETGECVMDIILGLLSERYECSHATLYASDFEVPQNRRRVIIMGIRKDLGIRPSFPAPVSPTRIPVSAVLQPRAEVSNDLFLSPRALQGIRNKKERMRRENKRFGAQILDPDRPSFTIPARYWKDGYDALVQYSDTEVRRLSLLEIKRIQTFPDFFILVGSKKDQIMQLGNAVPCRFASHLGSHLRNLLASDT